MKTKNTAKVAASTFAFWDAVTILKTTSTRRSKLLSKLRSAKLNRTRNTKTPLSALPAKVRSLVPVEKVRRLRSTVAGLRSNEDRLREIYKYQEPALPTRNPNQTQCLRNRSKNRGCVGVFARASIGRNWEHTERPAVNVCGSVNAATRNFRCNAAAGQSSHIQQASRSAVIRWNRNS
jgi:hypothetical protein